MHILYIIDCILHIYIYKYIYIYIHILFIMYYICREGQLTHLFFPGRVGQGYGPDWTLAVSPDPCWIVTRRYFIIKHLKSPILVGKKPRRACQSVATGLWSCFIIKRHKKSYFGGEKNPGGNAKASPLACGKGRQGESNLAPWGCEVHGSAH